MPRYRVNLKDLQKGAKIEQREHPWASPARARRIARDHLQEKGPAAYRLEPVVDKIIKSADKRMGAKPIRRRSIRPFNPLTDSPW